MYELKHSNHLPGITFNALLLLHPVNKRRKSQIHFLFSTQSLKMVWMWVISFLVFKKAKRTESNGWDGVSFWKLQHSLWLNWWPMTMTERMRMTISSKPTKNMDPLNIFWTYVPLTNKIWNLFQVVRVKTYIASSLCQLWRSCPSWEYS